MLSLVTVEFLLLLPYITFAVYYMTFVVMHLSCHAYHNQYFNTSLVPCVFNVVSTNYVTCKKGKGSPYSITERRDPELIPVLGSQPAGDVSHKPGGMLPLLSARPAVTPATLKRAATNFAAWWTDAQWVWAVCLRLLPDSVATAICLLRLSPAR